MDTDATFHFEMSLLNVGMLSNSEAMLVTAAVSQSAMLPYVLAALVGSVTQRVTAVAMMLFVMHLTQSELRVQVVTVANAGQAAWKVAPHAVCMAFLLQSESAVVESKALAKVVTRNTFQLARFWLKAVAEEKVEASVVTHATFQPPMGWLNAAADPKVYNSVVTHATFQLARSWLNAVAEEKVELKSKHLATFQAAMFWLNAEAE